MVSNSLFRYNRPSAVIVLAFSVVLTFCFMAGNTNSLAQSDAAEEFTLAKFLEVPTLGSVAISPDGKKVAYRWSRRDLEDDKRISRLWLADAKEGTVKQLTFVDDGIGGITWRPDGTLSFIRTHDDESQVWVNPLDGSEPRPVTNIAGGVSAYWWSPDGTQLAVIADPKEEEAELVEDAEVVPEEDDRADWTTYDRLEQPQDYQQLWVVSALLNEPDSSIEARQLTQSPMVPSHVSWSPDGETLALTFSPRFTGLVDEDQQVALIDVTSGDLEVISQLNRHNSLATFSPDGKQLIYYADRDAELRAYQNLKDLVLRDLASGQEVVLTGETNLTLGGTGSTPAVAVVWDKKGRNVYLPASNGTTYDLYKIDVRKREIKQLTHLTGNIASVSIANGKVAYIESALDKPGSLMYGSLGSSKAEVLVSTNETVAQFDLPAAEKVSLPGHNGQVVEGFLFLPPGAGKTDKLPAIIEMHGGPYYRYGNAWSTRYPWQVLAKNGFAVLIVNPRGATAYGAESLNGVYRNFGTDDYEDIMAAIDALVEQGTFDGDRLGFTGYSYGGLMTNVVVSRTERFKAAVSIAGIWNYVSAMGQNNPQLFIDSYDKPWGKDLQLMWEHSPAARANKITTPTLIMHGKEDHPVDPRQSIEMFTYLQLNNVPSRLVLYPGEGHGINRPSHMIDYETRELQWFLHYVMGQEDAIGAEVPVPVED